MLLCFQAPMFLFSGFGKDERNLTPESRITCKSKDNESDPYVGVSCRMYALLLFPRLSVCLTRILPSIFSLPLIPFCFFSDWTKFFDFSFFFVVFLLRNARIIVRWDAPLFWKAGPGNGSWKISSFSFFSATWLRWLIEPPCRYRKAAAKLAWKKTRQEKTQIRKSHSCDPRQPSEYLRGSSCFGVVLSAPSLSCARKRMEEKDKKWRGKRGVK